MKLEEIKTKNVPFDGEVYNSAEDKPELECMGLLVSVHWQESTMGNGAIWVGSMGEGKEAVTIAWNDEGDTLFPSNCLQQTIYLENVWMTVPSRPVHLVYKGDIIDTFDDRDEVPEELLNAPGMSIEIVEDR